MYNNKCFQECHKYDSCSKSKSSESLVNRGLVKWYDRGLQNLWREFDSLIPCLYKESLVSGKSKDFGDSFFVSCF